VNIGSSNLGTEEIEHHINEAIAEKYSSVTNLKA
jgi:hypothetical protein